jgi:replicative superfamily II helicase
MALVQALPEADNTWTPMFKKGTRESVRVSEATDRFSHRIVNLLQRQAGDNFAYLAGCKRASILADWIQGVSTETIERSYSVTPFAGKASYGDIRHFADVTRFHLRAAHQIANVLFLSGGLTEEAIEQLLRRLEVGLPEEALPLLALPVALDRGGHIALFSAGARDVTSVWTLSDAQIIALVGSLIGPQLVTKRPQAMST